MRKGMIAIESALDSHHLTLFQTRAENGYVLSAGADPIYDAWNILRLGIEQVRAQTLPSPGSTSTANEIFQRQSQAPKTRKNKSLADIVEQLTDQKMEKERAAESRNKENEKTKTGKDRDHNVTENRTFLLNSILRIR